MKTCSIEGCNNKYCAKGFCSKHYQRFMKYGDPNFVKCVRVRVIMECSIEGCNKKHYAKGFCKKHYQRFLRHGDPNFVKQIKECSIEGCNNKYFAKGFCAKHYQRFLKYGDPNFVKQIRTVHGYSKHPLYAVWAKMKERCYNSNENNFNSYGGRGIKVSDKWKNNSKAFIEWAIVRWRPGLELNRIDNDGDYEPSNCNFVTHSENMQNQRLLRENNTSGYRGVCFNKAVKKWVVNITIYGKNKYLGLFNSPRLAAIRYDVEAYLTDNRPRNFS